MDATSPTPPPAKDLSRSEISGILFGILTAMFLAALDQTIVATAMPTIGRALGDVEHISWVVTSYLLASTAVTPLYGKLSDIHGRRVVMLAGIVIFTVGSVACALAPNMLTLILARALQGLGGGGLISLAQTIIGDMVPPRERARYQVHIASVFVASSLAGPVLGGLFAEYLHWSMIFWINLPLAAVAYAMTSGRLKKLPRHERRHKLDYLGAILLVAATVLLMLALSWGGARYAWTSAEILGLLAGSVLLWVAFTARLLTAAEPFIPLALFSNTVVTTGTLSSCFTMGTFIGLTIYVPIYLQSVMGLSVSMSGFALIPLMAGTVTGATLSGRYMARTRHYKRPALAGLVLSTVTTLVLVFYPRQLPLLVVEVLFALMSLGLGTVLPVVTVSIQNAVPMHQLGTATANMNFFRSLGGALMVALFGAILLSGLADRATGGSIEEILVDSTANAAAVAGVFRWIFLGAAAGFALALLFLVLMKELPLRGRSVEAAGAAIAD